MNILISAYTINPNKGSESGMGWNWILQIAKNHNLFVITELEGKTEIEKQLKAVSGLQNIDFYFNDVGGKARRMCWSQGDYRFYYYYRKWQWKTYKIALDLIKQHDIDIIHQLNMIGYREPGFLWKIKNIPFIWGPVGGFVFLPKSYLPELGFTYCILYTIKNIANHIQAKSSARVKKAIYRASAIIASTPNTQIAIKKYFKRESIVINETGCNESTKLSKSVVRKKHFDIIWVGRFIPTKLLRFTLKIAARLKHLDGIKLHIFGGNSLSRSYLDLVSESQGLGLSEICVWHGLKPLQEIHSAMQKADLLLFPSLSEATSTVVMEALENSLPVMCFDTCGHGAVVDESVGRKLKISQPKQNCIEFADEIERLYLNRRQIDEMRVNCTLKAKEYGWNKKGELIDKIYQDTVTNFKAVTH